MNAPLNNLILVLLVLNAGDVLTKENLHSLRPCPEDGIPPYKINSLLGKRLLCDKISGAHISWMDVE